MVNNYVSCKLTFPLYMGKQNKHQHVILLHGMGRTWRSMWRMSHSLRLAGYPAHNTGYPSTHHPIQYLADSYVRPAVEKLSDAGKIHFVTHSLGGILVRQYLQKHSIPKGSRIVMLSPPNHGSEVADKLTNWKPYQWLNGPAGQQLGTNKNSVPNQLGPIDYEAGIITGNKSTNPLFSSWINGEDDSKVSVSSARLTEMKDFLVVPASHSFIMNKTEVIRQVIHFIEHGCFIHTKQQGSL